MIFQPAEEIASGAQWMIQEHVLDGVDVIMVTCSIAQNLQQCVSRMNNPLNPLVLTIATIYGGNCWNLIANRVQMEGTVRSFSDALFCKIHVIERADEDWSISREPFLKGKGSLFVWAVYYCSKFYKLLVRSLFF